MYTLSIDKLQINQQFYSEFQRKIGFPKTPKRVSSESGSQQIFRYPVNVLHTYSASLKR